MTTAVLSVSGMTCMHCVARVKKAALALAGVKDVQVDLAAKTATVEFDPQQVNLSAIKEAITASGYPAE